jgi:aryl-alcohol dehydrogenase-like predicted oxidoreductase
MKTRALGPNGPQVNPLGYGAMSFSDFYGPTDEAESHAMMDLLRDEGITHIDTANVYGMGKSEAAIGSYLRANPGAKDQFTIATKATISRHPDTGERFFNNDPAHLEAELDKSLERLGLDCVDLFYAHRRNPDVAPEELAGALGRLVEKGKTRAIGLSEVAPWTLRRAFAEHPVAAVQSEYSLWTRQPEMGLLQACAALGTAFVAFSPVGRSMLTDAPLSFAQAQEIPFLKENPRFMQPHYDINTKAIDGLRALAAEMGVPTAGLAIAWVLAQGEHVIAIPGTRKLGHFREYLAAEKIQLSAEDLARIETILPVGFAYGDRYTAAQSVGPERYC